MSTRRLLLALFASSAATTAYASLETCLKAAGISGEIVLPADSNYTNASAPVNRALMYKPAGIVFLATPADATAALACAVQAGVPVVSRSARHNYASFSEGGRDGSLVLDTTRLDSVTYDAATGYATVGLGNRLGNLALALNKTGRATPHGTCAFVGAGGHALCGGFGMWSRQHGLFLDQHVSAQVVIANGSVVTASRDQNSDLFWALRGAGPSFGTVLSVTIKTYPQPDSVTRFIVTFPNIASVDTAAKFFAAFQDFAGSRAPPQLGVRISISVSGSSFTSVRIHGVYYGPTVDFTTAFQPLLNALPIAPANQNIRSMTYIQSVTDLEQTGQLNTTGKGLQTWTGYRKSFLVPSAQPLSLATWTRFANYSINEPKPGLFLWAEIDAFGGSYGGQPTFIPSVPEDDAAFNGRGSVLLMQF